MIPARTGIAEVDEVLARYAEASGLLAAAFAAAAAVDAGDDGPEARALGRLRDAQHVVDAARADVLAALRGGDVADARRRLAEAAEALLGVRSAVAPELRRVTAERLGALQRTVGTAHAAWEAAAGVFVAVSELGVDAAFDAAFDAGAGPGPGRTARQGRAGAG